MTHLSARAILNLISAGQKFTQVPGYADYEKSCLVELVKSAESRTPQLHFSWVPQHNVHCLSAEDAAKFEQLGFKPEKDEHPVDSERPFHLWLQEPERRHLWLMNFRRYSWSYSSEKNGEYGYGGGETYANGQPIAFLGSTPAEVIRDALVATWTELQLKERLPKSFFCREVEAALRVVLDEAVAHASEYANPDRNSGNAVSYLPAMKVDLPDVKLEQPPRKAIYDWKRRDANDSIFQTLIGKAL